MQNIGYNLYAGANGAQGLGGMFPNGIICVEAIGDVPPDFSFEEEDNIIAGAVEGRQLEFLRGRSCARRAIAFMGGAAVAIPRGQDREPLWPSSYVGAITHTDGHCMAAIGHSDKWSGIGVDVEQVNPVAPSLERRLLTDAERRRLAFLPSNQNWIIATFSAKEAFFKAWFPQTHKWIGFQDAEIYFFPSLGQFKVKLLAESSISMERKLMNTRGHFHFSQGKIITTICLS